MQYFGFDRPSFAFKTFGFGSSEFSPLDLFAGGKQGVWYDPSDKSTLFQDAAGTVPVTKDGDPVALMLDKSGNGNHATQSVSAARPIYKTDGILHWLTFDGVDDYLLSLFGFEMPDNLAITMGVREFVRPDDKYCGILEFSPESGSVTATFAMYSKSSIADRGYLCYVKNVELTRTSAFIDTAYIFNIMSSSDKPDVYLQFNNETKIQRLKGAGSASFANIMIGSSGNIHYLLGNVYGLLVVIDDASSKELEMKDYMAKKSGVTL